jgi:NAD(P)H dehydrogenase (quinone)
MILITGATGHYGQEVLSLMLKQNGAGNLAALARNPEKLVSFAEKGVSVRKGDYNNTESLADAFKGVDTLLFVSASEIGNRLAQHTNVVTAAKKAGIKHVVYTSFQRASDNPNSPIAFITNDHVATEKLLIESGMDYTILRHALYLEVLPMFMGPTVMQTGVFLPAGNGKAAYASRSDMAKAAANILSTDGHRNQIYDISAPVAYSFHDIAAELTTIKGSAVGYVSPTADEFKQALPAVGVPDELIGMTIGFTGGIANGEFDCASPKLAELLGRQPVTPAEFLASTYK